jgi:hypothetical protein
VFEIFVQILKFIYEKKLRAFQSFKIEFLILQQKAKTHVKWGLLKVSSFHPLKVFVITPNGRYSAHNRT